MNPAVSTTLRRALRTISTVLSFAILINQSVHAATIHQVPAPTQTPQPTPPPQSSVPAQIAAAHTIFLVNNGADANFPLSAEDAYNEIYAALQEWGHFQLVSSPDQADLVFQLRDIAPITDVQGSRAGVYAINSPAFRLAIKDPRTNVTLWTITSPVPVAGRRTTRARWLNIAITNMVSRVKVLANQPLSETETADLTLAPRYRGSATALIIIGVVAGASVAGALIAKHEFDQNEKNQQATLCAQNPFFCTTP
jgi:hypothetical protein